MYAPAPAKPINSVADLLQASVISLFKLTLGKRRLLDAYGFTLDDAGPMLVVVATGQDALRLRGMLTDMIRARDGGSIDFTQGAGLSLEDAAVTE